MFKLIAGPCVIESEENVMLVAKKIKEITDKLDIPFVFKSSIVAVPQYPIPARNPPHNW